MALPTAFRILHVISSVNPLHGGPIEGIKRFSEVLARRGCTSTIVSLDSPDDPWVADCPVAVHATGIRSAWYKTLKRWLPFLRYGYTPHFASWLHDNATRYDAIIVNGLWNYCGLGSQRALRRSGTPYFVFTHGMLDPWFRRTFPLKTLGKQIHWWFGEGPLITGAAGVLFTTEEERLLARNAFWPYRCREVVVGYGTGDVGGDPIQQQAAFRHAVPGLGNRQYLLFLSRLHVKKGCDLLIDAFATIAARHPGLDLVMAGPDQDRRSSALRKMADGHGLANRVHWPGMLSGAAKWGAFRFCEAFVLPSHQENFGIVVAEAMACGRPVIITNKVNIWREVDRYGGGIVCDDAQEPLTGAILAFLDKSDTDRIDMGARARRCFVGEFHVENVMQKLLSLLRETAMANTGRKAVSL